MRRVTPQPLCQGHATQSCLKGDFGAHYLSWRVRSNAPTPGVLHGHREGARQGGPRPSSGKRAGTEQLACPNVRGQPYAQAGFREKPRVRAHAGWPRRGGRLRGRLEFRAPRGARGMPLLGRRPGTGLGPCPSVRDCHTRHLAALGRGVPEGEGTGLGA